MTKTLLLASFIKKENIDKFKENLNIKFNVPLDKIFFFEIQDDSKVIITFKLNISIGERLDIKKHFKNTIPIHKKGTTLYTINALNKLIEKESELEIGNINYKNYKVQWDKFQNTFILNNSNELVFMPINRAFY